MDSALDRLDAYDWGYLREAATATIETQFGSTHMIQRKLRIGFAKAALLTECLQEIGVVGPPRNNRARDVLATSAEADNIAAVIDSAQNPPLGGGSGV